MGRVCMVRDLVAELVMGRVCYGPSLSWAEFVMGRDVPESGGQRTSQSRDFRTHCNKSGYRTHNINLTDQ